MRLFNPAVFGSPTFNVGEEDAPPTPEPSGGGHRGPGPIRVSLDLTPEDDEEWALFVALARHRLRL